MSITHNKVDSEETNNHYTKYRYRRKSEEAYNTASNTFSLISYGIICYKNFKTKTTENEQQQQNKKNKYKIILIRRKNTIGYVEFLRGKYDLDKPEYLIKLFDYMTKQEKKNILEIQDFDSLRALLGMTKKNNIYKAEYEKAHKKFNILKSNESTESKNNKLDDMSLKHLISQSSTEWTETEWGIPKGRKQQKELDLNCGIREFVEETNISSNDFKVLFNVKPIVEEYTSINGVNYKHIYYFAHFTNENDELCIDPKNKNQTSEINGIQWVDREDCQTKIRDYYIEKKEVTEKAFNILDELDNYDFLY
jgi:8-oxo-dGTP pyrophosphatase MutT (NUDIX family)